MFFRNFRRKRDLRHVSIYRSIPFRYSRSENKRSNVIISREKRKRSKFFRVSCKRPVNDVKCPKILDFLTSQQPKYFSSYDISSNLTTRNVSLSREFESAKHRFPDYFSSNFHPDLSLPVIASSVHYILKRFE